MDEISTNADTKYALQIALQTLKERCQQFQERVSILEEENLNLKVKSRELDLNQEESLSEIDRLRSKISELNEEKTQLRNNVSMVASENRQLWSRLAKLSQVNQNLGSQLHKISDSIAQHAKPQSQLIRSRTFTQHEPHMKLQQKMQLVDENGKISLDLEDISLKMLNSIAKEKSELEEINIPDLQQLEPLGDLFAFNIDDDDKEDSIAESFEQHLSDLKHLRNNLSLQKDLLIKHLNNLKSIKDKPCIKCEEHKKLNVRKVMINVAISTDNCTAQNDDDIDVKRQLDSLANWGSSDKQFSACNSKAKSLPMDSAVFICPICRQRFRREIGFESFYKHVENHFLLKSSMDIL